MTSNSTYRGIADKAVDAMSDIAEKTGLNKIPDKIVVLPHYMLPEGVIAAVGKTYNSTKTLFLNAKETYNMKYDDFKGVLTHEMAHLWEMSGGKLSEIITPQSAYQEILLDAPLLETKANEGRINAVATKLAEKAGYGTEVLNSAYKRETTYFNGLMSVVANLSNATKDIYHSITGCGGCNKNGYGC